MKPPKRQQLKKMNTLAHKYCFLLQAMSYRLITQLIIASFLCCSWSDMNGQSPDKLSAIWNGTTETTEHRLEAAEQLINMLLDNAPNAAFDLIDKYAGIEHKREQSTMGGQESPRAWHAMRDGEIGVLQDRLP